MAANLDDAGARGVTGGEGSARLVLPAWIAGAWRGTAGTGVGEGGRGCRRAGPEGNLSRRSPSKGACACDNKPTKKGACGSQPRLFTKDLAGAVRLPLLLLSARVLSSMMSARPWPSGSGNPLRRQSDRFVRRGDLAPGLAPSAAWRGVAEPLSTRLLLKRGGAGASRQIGLCSRTGIMTAAVPARASARAASGRARFLLYFVPGNATASRKLVCSSLATCVADEAKGAEKKANFQTKGISSKIMFSLLL